MAQYFDAMNDASEQHWHGYFRRLCQDHTVTFDGREETTQ